jgi:transketolase
MDAMRAAFARTATDLLDEDPRVAIVLAEISGQYFGDALARHPDRVVNVGIMEATMVGVAAGFALEGFHPIAHSIAPFIAERPYEQIKLDFGYQGLGGTFVGVGGSYDYAAEGGTHHAPGDVAALLAIPGVEILVPGHGSEVEPLLRATYANGRPTYLRTSPTANVDGVDVAPGRIEVLRRGALATIVTVGPMLTRTLEAVRDLDVTVLYATSVRPFDARALAATVGEDPLVITVEPFYEGTLVPALAEALQHVPARYATIGVPRAFIHAYGTAADLHAELGLDAAGIRRQVTAALDSRGTHDRTRSRQTAIPS